tara:strand:- start:1 stop:525 length:525 start_codon:yes stop_codon:yes gene_type:complete
MEPFIGQIQAFGFNFAPAGWAICEGQLLPIAQYQALFSLLGTTFGGDGETTFGLPDLRGRSIVGVGNGPGLNPTNWGQRSGAENHTLTNGQMPSHNHTATTTIGVSTSEGSETNIDGKYLANHPNAFNEDPTAGASMGGATSIIDNNGGGQSFPIRDPYLGINVCIALTGIFPS